MLVVSWLLQRRRFGEMGFTSSSSSPPPSRLSQWWLYNRLLESTVGAGESAQESLSMNSKVGLIFTASSLLEFSKVLFRVGLCTYLCRRSGGTGGGVFATTPLIFSTSRLTGPPGTTTTENLPQPDPLSLFYLFWKQNWVMLGKLGGLKLRYLCGSDLPSLCM